MAILVTLNGTEDANLWLFSKKKLAFYNFLWILVEKVTFWKEFPLGSMKNSKSLSVYVISFLNKLRKSIFYHRISENILYNF